MALTITGLTDYFDNVPSIQDPDNFETYAGENMTDLANVFASGGDIHTFITETNALAAEAETNAGDAETAKTAAEAAQTAAEAAETAALQSANATIYAAGTTYAAGDIVLDPGDNYFSYTSQQAANTGNTPNSDDGTWWELSIADTTNAINNADAKTTPVDADLIGLIDSAAANVLKKVTWANLKATISSADYIANQVFS